MSSSDVSAGPASHGPGHRGCPTCDPAGGQPTNGHRRPSVVRITARGDQFKIIQVVGNLFVCSKANGNCCCGWSEKGRMPFDNALWSEEWERRMIRARVHLTFSGCLGPCAIGNNALLQIYGRSIWFKDLNSPTLAPLVFNYIEAMLAVDGVLPVPEDLAGHVYERYLTPDEDAPVMSFAQNATPVDPVEALEGLDPVCLMEVDVDTAKQKVEYNGHTLAFCGPACRKMFNADPEAYLGPAGAVTT